MHSVINSKFATSIYFITFLTGTLSGKDIVQIFGTSREFVGSVTHALEGKTYTNNDDLCKSLDLEAAKEVASCGYECSTAWGEKVGNGIKTNQYPRK